MDIILTGLVHSEFHAGLGACVMLTVGWCATMGACVVMFGCWVALQVERTCYHGAPNA